jgi:pimeloyl-ACP methyl ester carboxylesterase
MEVFNSIWPEAAKLRESGKLLEIGKKIKCEVVAIHGDYDSHPFLGVKDPLTKVINTFKFILLEKCGHHPWFEKHAKDKFYEVLLGKINKP